MLPYFDIMVRNYTLLFFFSVVNEHLDCRNHPGMLVKCSTNEIQAAYQILTGKISDILAGINFKKLRRACFQEIRAPTSTLPESLVQELKATESLDDMLDVLALSPYWNWFDTRLLQALVSASGSPEAEKLLKNFMQKFYTKKLTEVIPHVIIKPFKESVNISEMKFEKDPNELTILELLQHKFKLEYETLDVDERKLVLSCIRVELT